MAVKKAAPTALVTQPKTTNAIQTRQDELPEFMRGKAGKGVEHIGSDAVEIPRLVLLQALSEQVASGDFQQGHFFHTVAEQSLGNEVSLTIVYAHQSFILWRPRESGGGILARAQDGIHWQPADAEFEVALDKAGKNKVTWKTRPTVIQSGLAEWGSQDPSDPASPPAATRMFNLVCMLHDFPEYSPCVVTLQRAAIKVGRKLMGKLKIAQAPVFGLKFKMESTRDSNNQSQEFWNYQFTTEGLVTDEDTFKNFESMYDRFQKEGVRIRDVEGLQDDPTPTDKGGEAAGAKHAGKM